MIFNIEASFFDGVRMTQEIKAKSSIEAFKKFLANNNIRELVDASGSGLLYSLKVTSFESNGNIGTKGDILHVGYKGHAVISPNPMGLDHS